MSGSQPNGHVHLIGLGSASALPEEARNHLERTATIAWVTNIYAAAAEHAQKRHAYAALLLDLRALPRPQFDAVLTLSRCAGLPVWLLPVDTGRTRMDAAMAAGAIPWSKVVLRLGHTPTSEHPQVSRLEQSHAAAAHMEISRDAKIPAAAKENAASRLAQILAGSPVIMPPKNGAHRPVQDRRSERAVPLIVPGAQEKPPDNGDADHSEPHDPPRQRMETPVISAVAESATTIAEAHAQPTKASAPPAPSTAPASAARKTFSPLDDLPARFFQPADATSEKKKAIEEPADQVILPPINGYDEASPVLTEEELRALLDPPE